MHKLIDKLESICATIIAGIFLIASFTLSKLNIKIYMDLAWVTLFICGIPLLYSAVKKLIKNKGIKKISSALLITMAMVASICINDLFAAAEVAFIMAIGEILEELTTKKAKKGLKNLLDLTPKQGRLIQNNTETLIEADKIQTNNILRILPGETIPVDGIIIKGQTSIDQSIITGESIPLDKTIGDEVFCGTVNCFGAIDIQATKVGQNTSLQKLIQLVKEAENKKSPIQRITDKWASILVPVALLISIITFIITKDIIRAVTILVVFCPCALVLATPTAIMAAIGQATKYGIIIKSPEALEKMNKVDTIAFDKTGTITKGQLQVSDIITFNDISKEDLLYFAASAEAKSTHPLAKAIVNYAKTNNIHIEDSINFNMLSGKGLISEILHNKDTKKIICGNKQFLQEHNIMFNEISLKKESYLTQEGKVLVFVAVEDTLLGIIALTDTIKENIKTIIQDLQNLKISSVLLTGDNQKTANYFSNLAGIKTVFANLLPEQKVKQIINLQNQNKVLCMVGDGINDAPALKIANLGIAMGAIGTDIAVDAADIALMDDDISKLLYLKKLSKATVRTIKFSISLSMIINFIAVVLSVLGLLTPTTGALVHNAGSVFVILIAAFLYEKKI